MNFLHGPRRDLTPSTTLDGMDHATVYAAPLSNAGSAVQYNGAADSQMAAGLGRPLAALPGGADLEDHEDNLADDCAAPFRGILYGVALGVVTWAALLLGVL